MKNTCLSVFILLLMIPASAAFAQKNVTQSKDVIKTADLIEFKYKETLKKAANQDISAVAALFEFSRILDGQQVLDHALTCLELFPLATDPIMAKAIQNLNPNLKKVSLERLLEAQGQTAQEALKKPIETWAPYSWEALNNRPVIFESAQSAENQQGSAIDAAAGSLKDAEKVAPQATDGSMQSAPKPDGGGRGN